MFSLAHQPYRYEGLNKEDEVCKVRKQRLAKCARAKIIFNSLIISDNRPNVQHVITRTQGLEIERQKVGVNIVYAELSSSFFNCIFLIRQVA